MSARGRWEMFRADVGRYVRPEMSLLKKVGVCAETQGVWACAVYRFGQWVYEGPRGAGAVPLKASYKVSQKLVEVTTGISLPASAQIGPGLYIGHFGQIFFHKDMVAGKNLSVGQGVTIGEAGVGKGGIPKLGDDVYVGVGAKILGSVSVGDGARVGANAVVVKDVPAGATVVGIPAKVVRSREEAR